MKEDRSPVQASWLEAFEHRIVFKVARGYFIFMASIAVLVFAGGIIAGFFGFVRVPVMKASDPPAIPQPEPLNLAAVEKWTADQQANVQVGRGSMERSAGLAEQATQARSENSTDKERTRRKQQKDQIETLVIELKALFPDPPYAWDDVFKVTCSNYIQGYGCIRQEKNLEKKGIESVLSEKLRGNSPDEIIAKLEALKVVLAEASVDKRGELLVVTIDAFEDIRRGYTQKVNERETVIARNESEYEENVASQRESKGKFRTWGLYGVSSGLALIVLISIFLAHLAIERHARLMRNVIESFEKTAGSWGSATGSRQGASVLNNTTPAA